LAKDLHVLTLRASHLQAGDRDELKEVANFAKIAILIPDCSWLTFLPTCQEKQKS